MTEQRRWQRSLPYGLLAVVVLASVLLPAPALLGSWESSTVFSTFGVRWNALSLAIAPRGNIGGAGYFLLEMSRSIVTQIGLHPSLFTLRIPVMACGAIALIFFFVIAKRWFGPWPALGATAMMAVNPVFSQYQHELIIAGPSLMAFLVFFERLQALALNRERWRNWLTLSLALVLVLLLYGPGRILAVTLLGLWLTSSLLRLWRSPARTGALRLLGQALLSAAVVAVGLVVAAPTNIRFLGPGLFFPKNSENFLVSDSGVPYLETLILNGRITIESLLLGGGPHHSAFLEASLSSGRFPMIPLLIVPIYLAGFVLCVIQLIHTRARVSSPYAAILMLAALTTLPMLTSSVFSVVEGMGTAFASSLSNYRLVYFLIPAYLSVAVALAWVAKCGMRARAVSVVVVTALLVAGGWTIIESRSRFEHLVATINPSLVADAAGGQWSVGRRQVGFSNSWASHLQQHAQYDRWAADTARGLAATVVPDGVVVLSTSIGCFPEAPLRPNGPDFYDVNYHDVFLALYLSEHLPDLNVGYAFLPPPGEAQRTLVEKTAMYSAVLSEIAPGVYDYADFDRGGSGIVSLNGAAPDVILTTTTKEREFVLSELDSRQTKYRIVDSKSGC